MRILFWLILLVGVAYLVRKKWREFNKTPPSPSSTTTPALGEAMLRCHHCGVFVPVSEALQENGQNYCCDQHRALHQQ
jgi:uncharacterized protein